MKRIAVILAITICAFLLADLAHLGFKLVSFDWRSNTRSIIETGTVPTFGYNSLRSGAVQSSLTADSYTPLVVQGLPSSEGSSYTMPLYFDGDQVKLPGLKGRRLIFFGTAHHFNAFDIDDNELVWSKELPLPTVGQAAVLDPERGKIYFTAGQRKGQKPSPAWAREKFEMMLFSVNLDGSDMRSREVDLDSLVYPDQPPSDSKPSHVMKCRTALGLNDHNNPRYVFWGCGMDFNAAQNHYGNLRGAHGVLVVAYLDEAGEFVESGTFATFNPSAVTTNPRTGFDTGIWNGGAGPSLLGNNTLLLATGNGPFIPAEGNYGCSVISLDGQELQPKSKLPGGQSFYSQDDRGFNECHESNMDIGSSSVASLEAGEQVYSAIMGKSGHLRVFNPHDLPGDDPEKKSKVLIGRDILGQPNVLFDIKGEVQVVAGGGKLSHPFFRESDYVVATTAQANLLEAHGYRKNLCLGLVARYAKGKRLRLDLHYSGQLRNDHVTLPMETTIGRLISDGEFEYANWSEAAAAAKTGKTGSYKSLQTIGHTFDQLSENAPPGYQFSLLKLYASARGGLFSFPETLRSNSEYKLRQIAPQVLKGGLLSGRSTFPQEYGSIAHTSSPDDNGYCGENDDPEYERLYLYQLPKKTPRNGWAINSFNISKNLQLTSKWTYLRDDETRYSPSHMVTLFSTNGEPGLVVFAIGDSESSYLVLLNSETGELIDEIPFSGLAYFTMPLIVDEKIYLATRDDGIKVFRRSESFLELVQRFSFFGKLLVH